MTRLELMSRLCTIEEDLSRLTVAVEEALRPAQAEFLLGDLTRLTIRLSDVIEALPRLEDTP